MPPKSGILAVTQTSDAYPIEFNKPKKYRRVKILGEGACGQTIQIRDDEMKIDLVAKKFKPNSFIEEGSEVYTALRERFCEEARILFRINHPNVVRVYGYYDYRNYGTSYIIMELVEGLNVMDFAKKNPNHVDKIFEKVLDGFVHLESESVLHRDIRPENILVAAEGEPKIIDFGFGKQIETDNQNADKSISLNWWCTPPPEFDESIYDFQTEVYFLGKLFQKIIENGTLSEFKYTSIIRDMCSTARDERPSSFSDVWNRMMSGQFEELSFTDDERAVYGGFSDGLVSIFAAIDTSPEYCRDTNEVIERLDDLYRNVMLEKFIYAPDQLGQIFVRGKFDCEEGSKLEVSCLKNFLGMLKGLSEEKRHIVLGNILTRLDSVERPEFGLGDIPF